MINSFTYLKALIAGQNETGLPVQISELRLLEQFMQNEADTLKNIRKDIACWEVMKDSLGYVEDGSAAVVTVFQDDATKVWIAKIDKKAYYGNTLNSAIANMGARDNNFVKVISD